MAKGFLDGYKTYDTSAGFGTRSQWKSAFSERMGIDEAEEYLKNTNVKHESISDLYKCKTLVELKSLFKNLMKIHHPDKGGDTGIAQQIIAAYTILKEKYA